MTDLPPIIYIDNFIVDYVWLDGHTRLRSKTRVLKRRDLLSTSDSNILYLFQIPEWNYDGSSTYQANNHLSEIILKPQALFKCPFKQGAYIVMCDTYYSDMTPTLTNHRVAAETIFNKYSKEYPTYGIEQEYFIYNSLSKLPLGFPIDDVNGQGQYYCSVGQQNAFGRTLSDEHMILCLEAGIQISGTNAEVAPGQWEYQIGPVIGIAAADQLWISRYILERLTEYSNYYIVWDPKPLASPWNGSGCHVNFSTRQTMLPNVGINYIYKAINNLGRHHTKHMAVYGEGNEKRMIGNCETSSYNTFTYGVGNRSASVRIPNTTQNNKSGYFEDRRPASNMDPYLVLPLILDSCMDESL